MNILYQSDDNYAPYMGISITSLLMNKKEDSIVNLYILDGGISEDNKEKVKVTCDSYGVAVAYLSCVEIEKKIEQSGVQKYRGSYATFYKLYIKEVLPDDVERILYIDCDTIIKGDLADLYNTDIGINPIAMAEDLLLYKYKKNFGYKIEESYFNAGIVLYDIRNMISGSWWNKLGVFLREYPIEKLAKHEQDIINLCFRNNIYKLPLRFNAQSILALGTAKQIKRVYGKNINYSCEDIKEESEKAVIYHFLEFCGGQPWVENSIHPYTELYRTYKEGSQWNGQLAMNYSKEILICIEEFLYKYAPRCVFLFAFRWSHDLLNTI